MWNYVGNKKQDYFKNSHLNIYFCAFLVLLIHSLHNKVVILLLFVCDPP